MSAISFDRLHGGADPAQPLDFSVNLSPFGPPPEVIQAFHAAADQLARYPEPYSGSLVSALSERLDVAASNIVAGNGSTQLFYLFSRAFRPRRPLIVIPTFSEIANSLILQSIEPLPLKLRAEELFRFNPAKLHAAMTSGIDAIFLGRPNSPTGTALEFAELEELADRCCRSGCWCVVDEAFIDFADDQSQSAILTRKFPRLILVRSMTKLYAVPGLRLGFLLGDEEVVAQLTRHLEPWSVSGPAVAVGRACLELPESWRQQVRRMLAQEREYVAANLGALSGMHVFPSVANFLMLSVTAETPGHNFGVHLRSHGIAIRDLAALPGAGAGFYRIGVRLREDNELLLNAARRWC